MKKIGAVIISLIALLYGYWGLRGLAGPGHFWGGRLPGLLVRLFFVSGSTVCLWGAWRMWLGHERSGREEGAIICVIRWVLGVLLIPIGLVLSVFLLIVLGVGFAAGAGVTTVSAPVAWVIEGSFCGPMILILSIILMTGRKRQGSPYPGYHTCPRCGEWEADGSRSCRWCGAKQE
jgi:hypothetical protein